MRAKWKVGKTNDVTLTGWTAVVVSLAYILVWLLIAAAAVKVAWAIVFGDLL